MSAEHLIFLVEEDSMEAFLRGLLPRFLPETCAFEIQRFQGKPDLVRKLHARFVGYKSWLPEHFRIFVLVDRDNEDCKKLKEKLEAIAKRAKLSTKTASKGRAWQVVNRIVIEELEAWYFGDWAAVRLAYPRASSVSKVRKSDDIQGGTAESFERVMQKFGYFGTGLRKIEAARAISAHVMPDRSISPSFHAFYSALKEAVGLESQ